MKRVLDDLSIFCAVVETGTLKSASEKLAIPHSTVSRRIEALEQSLGLVLLHRTTRDVKASKVGLSLYRDCEPMLSAMRDSIASAVEAEVQYKGRLRVSLPVRAGIDFLGEWLIDFAQQHPGLQLDIALSNSNKNLVQDDIDLAFRVGPLVDSSAIALRLWDIPYVVCATKDYLERHTNDGVVRGLNALESLPSVVSRPATKWMFVDEQQQESGIFPQMTLQVDDLGLARYAALTGQYMAMLPESMLQGTTLETLKVSGFQPRTRVMYAYYLGRRHAQSQIRHLVEYIRQRCAG